MVVFCERKQLKKFHKFFHRLVPPFVTKRKPLDKFNLENIYEIFSSFRPKFFNHLEFLEDIA